MLPMPDICTTALKIRAEVKQSDRDAAGLDWQESPLVFTTRNGTPIDPRNLTRAWDARCRRAAIRKITVPDARRTCATLLVDLDVHPRVIMQVLRHAEISLTMEIYSHASSHATRDALKRLGQSLR
jgi:integrase